MIISYYMDATHQDENGKSADVHILKVASVCFLEILVRIFENCQLVNGNILISHSLISYLNNVIKISPSNLPV